nr:nuclear transport factor 2 family protein [Streptomyces sp. NBC_00830]
MTSHSSLPAHGAADRLAIRELINAYAHCLAHHLSVGEDRQRTLMIASIRYLDQFVKQDGAWFFAERKLMVDWTETRPSAA